jgi:hypothetical protein
MAKDSPNEVATPFEGAEKLLEIWFAPSIDQVLDVHFAAKRKCGLRKVQRHVWDRMLDVVHCKILSVLEGDEMDLYLLRWVLHYHHLLPVSSISTPDLCSVNRLCSYPPIV